VWILAAGLDVVYIDNGTGVGVEPNIGRGLRGEAEALNGEIMPVTFKDMFLLRHNLHKRGSRY
jgi:hypothetical protein